jgi:YD repeat-containing protein
VNCLGLDPCPLWIRQTHHHALRPDRQRDDGGRRLGQRHRLPYDPLGRLNDADSDSHLTTYAYDLNSLLLSTTDPDGRRMAYQYNALNRLTTETWYNADS